MGAIGGDRGAMGATGATGIGGHRGGGGGGCSWGIGGMSRRFQFRLTSIGDVMLLILIDVSQPMA